MRQTRSRPSQSLLVGIPATEIAAMSHMYTYSRLGRGRSGSAKGSPLELSDGRAREWIASFTLVLWQAFHPLLKFTVLLILTTPSGPALESSFNFGKTRYALLRFCYDRVSIYRKAVMSKRAMLYSQVIAGFGWMLWPTNGVIMVCKCDSINVCSWLSKALFQELHDLDVIPNCQREPGLFVNGLCTHNAAEYQ